MDASITSSFQLPTAQQSEGYTVRLADGSTVERARQQLAALPLDLRSELVGMESSE